MTTTHDMNVVFNGFVEAAKALEEKPQLEAKIKELESQLAYAKADNEELHRSYQTLADDHAARRSRVAELEASLDEASKSHRDTEDHLAFLLDAVRGLSNTAHQAAELVAPTPVPEPEVTATTSPTPTTTTPEPEQTVPPIFTSGGYSSETSSESSAASEVTATTSDPTVATIQSVEPSLTVSSPSASSVESVSSTFSTLSGNPGMEAASIDSASSPFVSSTAGQSEPAPSSDGTAPQPSDTVNTPRAQLSADASQPKPYAGLRPWERPNFISWDDFVEGGGEAPPWYSKDNRY